MVKISKQRQAEARARCLEWLKPGDIVYTSVRHVAKSGMTRWIRVYLINDNSPRDISYTVADALGWKFDENYDAVKVGGCGMDMGFHLVYTLSSILFPNGFDCIREGCPANDHFNQVDTDHHNDGGYALKQRWM